jgi:hypothetical protein
LACQLSGCRKEKAVQTSGGQKQHRPKAFQIMLKGLSHSLRRCVAPQRRDCASLVPLNIKHSGQSSHLKQVIYSLIQVYEPKLTTLIPNSRVGLDQFAYS